MAAACEAAAPEAADHKEVIADEAAAAADPKSEDLLGCIKALKEQQKQMRNDRKRIAKDLRNAEKRRVRLRKRARQLSDDDLVALIRMRKDSASAAVAAAAAAPAPAEPAPAA